MLLSWLGLTIASIISYKWPHHSKSSDKAMDVFLQSMDGFLKAQCYFSIPIATATLLTDVFHLDPLNGYGFLPVAINGFLAQTFTLLQLHRNKRFSWYLSTLVFISWLLSTIILWAIIKYLTARPIGTQDFEFRSVSQINSCGGSSALVLCEQRLDRSPLSYLFYHIVAVTGYGPTILFGTTKILYHVLDDASWTSMLWQPRVRLFRISGPVPTAYRTSTGRGMAGPAPSLVFTSLDRDNRVLPGVLHVLSEYGVSSTVILQLPSPEARRSLRMEFRPDYRHCRLASSLG